MRLKLAIAFTVLIAVLLGVGWVALDRMARINDAIQEVTDRRWRKAQLSAEALDYSSLNSRITMQVFLTDDRVELDRLLKLRAENTQRISDVMRRIEAQIESDAERKLIGEVWARRMPYVTKYQEAIRLLLEQHQPDAARTMMAKKVLPALITYHEAWEDFVDFQGHQMDMASDRAEAYANDARREVLVLLMFGAVLAGGIAIFVTRNVTREAAERHRAQEALRESRASAPIGILDADAAGEAHYANAYWQAIAGTHAGEDLGRGWLQAVDPEDRDRVVSEWEKAVSTGESYTSEFRFRRPTGEIRWVYLRVARVKSARKQPGGFVATAEDITERKQAQARLAEMQRDLVIASRHAGMAEVATGILHNVNNVLNSVGVAATCVADSVKKSKAANLSKLVALIDEHQSDLGAFLTTDPRGKQIPVYLAQLAAKLAADQTEVLGELTEMQKSIEHIKQIVTLQQRGARASGAVEAVDLAELIDDTLRMDSGGTSDHEIEIVKQFEPVPPVRVEKHKVLQILMNLIRNAKQACRESGGAEKRITVRIFGQDGRVRIAVSDTGVGIAPENLDRIFSHGFSTKRDGHGFGLHTAMIDAKAMGGSLAVQSEGLGRGAEFTLELPTEGRAE